MKLKNWEIGLVAGIGAAAVAVFLNSCVAIPKGAKAVQPFDQQRYLGTWYEIARMDFKFEKNLSDVSATYSLNADGSIRVDNKGYNYVQQKWKESIGKAKPVKDASTGRLKVSFFGPFYAGYNVIAVDPGYRYALVAGNNLNYLWLLSREKSIPPAIQSAYLKQAQGLGYDVSKLVWTKHEH
ncbi:lipocalin family protein [Mucilaginibacter flavus]|uniref:lipocalin family protein n=1 Tax=Mucilaginibacter flavus TaxID=931504 RepID=UPI0025B60558|nr:lipocalin family protein [Mucilaginibacter flavus]MDN3583407.1 lipocalin family protein [Mucilaginibacter flavus]